MQTQIFPPKEVAMELKKVGFNEPCVAWYKSYHEDYSTNPLIVQEQRMLNSNIENGVGCCTAPTYDQVIGWFAEVHGIEIDPCGAVDMKSYYTDVIIKGIRVYDGTWTPNRQQSLLTAFREAIKLIEK